VEGRPRGDLPPVDRQAIGAGTLCRRVDAPSTLRAQYEARVRGGRTSTDDLPPVDRQLHRKLAIGAGTPVVAWTLLPSWRSQEQNRDRPARTRASSTNRQSGSEKGSLPYKEKKGFSRGCSSAHQGAKKVRSLTLTLKRRSTRAQEKMEAKNRSTIRSPHQQ